MSDSEAALVARIVEDDDRAAFELLVRRHQSAVRNFLRRLAYREPQRADDLAQETFLRLFRSIGTFRGQAKFSSWLYRIAYNVFLDDRRGRVAESSFEEGEHADRGDSTQGASNEVDFDSALRHLSDRQRAIFDLHYRKGMTHPEIAAALEVPLGTVKSDLTRGLAHLRQVLAIPEKH